MKTPSPGCRHGPCHAGKHRRARQAPISADLGPRLARATDLTSKPYRFDTRAPLRPSSKGHSMYCFRVLTLLCALGGLVGCGKGEDSTALEEAVKPPSTTVLDLDEVKTNPAAYPWFDFRPNLKKLIL